MPAITSLFRLCCFSLRLFKSLAFSHTFQVFIEREQKASLMISIDILMTIIRLLLCCSFYENAETFANIKIFMPHERKSGEA